MRFISKIIGKMGEWSLPPAVQPPIGQARDQDFAPPEPGIVEQIVGYWRGQWVYLEKPPRPIILRDPRAVENERIARERRRRRGEGVGPIFWLD
jgi:hypothetical protein